MDTDATLRFSRVLLTGPPGIGKTTICKKVIRMLAEKNCKFNGFYTEEVRVKNNRIGFDIIPVKQPEKRSALARTEKVLNQQSYSRHRVGNYHVFTDNFEATALPELDRDANILLIDEIGRMELFSDKFYEAVNNIFFLSLNKNVRVIATIPLLEKVPHRYRSFFQKLCTDNASKVVTVNRENRDKLPQEIVALLLQ